MAVSGITGLDGFKTQVDSMKRKLKGSIAEEYRKYVRNILKDLAMNTPQWSGDLAASWVVLPSKSDTAPGITKTPFKKYHYRSVRPPKHLGHMEAVNYALTANMPAIAEIRYNSYVTIVNENPTMELWRTGKAPRRPINRPDYTAEVVIDWVASKYQRKHIKPEFFNVS